MKNLTFGRSLNALRGLLPAVVLAAGLLPAMSQPAVLTPLGSTAGYVDGTFKDARFRTPSGMAMDYSGNYIYLADRDNNAIRIINNGASVVWTFGVEFTNLIAKPVAVSVNGNNDVTVLNRANGTNGSIITFNTYGESIFTNALRLTNAAAMALDKAGNIYVTGASNKVFRIDAGTTNRTTVATVAIAGANLQGLVVKRNGYLAVVDSGRNGIYLINPTNGVVSTNAGFHGAGDFPFGSSGANVASANQTKFNQPMGILEGGDGSLIVSDYGNHRVKLVQPSGVTTNLYGVFSTAWYGLTPGWSDGTVKIPDIIQPNVMSRLPANLLLASDGTLYTSEQYYHMIRKVTGANIAAPPPPVPAAPLDLAAYTNNNNTAIILTWTGSIGATNYYIKRSEVSGGPVYATIGSSSTASFTDTNATAGKVYFYVVSASNASGESPNSAQVSAFRPLLPVPMPQIGYIDYPATQLPIPYTSRFNAASSVVLNNDAQIVILGQADGQTFYTYGIGITNSSGSLTNPPDPTINSASALPGYADGSSFSQVSQFAIAQVQPDLTIKAMGAKNDGSPNSAVATARFQFVTANPVTIGANAAAFTVSDITAGAHLYYTIDGSDPDPNNVTNPPVDLGTVTGPTNVLNLSLAIQGDTVFKIRAFKANYQPSAVVITVFTLANYAPNTISFGFASGEASSSFIASPGQVFYAPVTLSLVGNPSIYSLQFNLVVTNGGPNPAVDPVTQYSFTSLLMKPAPNAFTNVNGLVYTAIPPLMFDGAGSFLPGIFTNPASSLLGVGWLERIGQTNLFNSTAQDLITYSQAHDILFPKSGGKTILGGYSIQIPQTAPLGSTYQISIGRPSATSDGVGANGSIVNISALTNGGFFAGSLNAVKYVTVGQFKYIVGSVYPFRWFNAGDFGSSNLVSADVAQVFQAAVYHLNAPPDGSDFFDAMDSCGNFGTPNGSGIYSQTTFYDANTPFLGNDPNAINLFDGSDPTTINQISFGDGVLDVCDVYVTFRRSLDPSLTWFRRYWSNGVRVADTGAPNIAPKVLTKTVTSKSVTTKVVTTNTTPPQVNFTAGDIVSSAGQTVQIPISATILGSYPIRTLMLNLTVVPLDGSPAISAPVSFTQTASVLGAPYTTMANGNGNYSAVWLNTTNSGLTGTVVLGNLNITIPITASSKAAYAIRFDHASASPNGLASFARQTLTGVLTTSTRTNSSFGDGIPDSWRLRWFGTTNNALSASNACPTGDGISNWKKFVAGVDPNVAGNFPSVKPKAANNAGYSATIQWPSVSGKKYAIERSTTLFGGSWSVLTTNTGTGGDMEFNDSTTNKVKFYRVRILP